MGRGFFKGAARERVRVPGVSPTYRLGFETMVTTLDMNVIASDAKTKRALGTLSMAVAKSTRIVVVTGAGISCSSGIPVSTTSPLSYVVVNLIQTHAGFPFHRWIILTCQGQIPRRRAKRTRPLRCCTFPRSNFNRAFLYVHGRA